MEQIADKLEAIRADISGKLSSSNKAAVLFSGGISSALLLSISHELAPDLCAVQFRTDMTADQLKIGDAFLLQLNCELLSYAPKHRYLLPNDDLGSALSLVDEYECNGVSIPYIRRFVHSDQHCSLQLATKRTPIFRNEFDLFLVGWNANSTLNGETRRSLHVGDKLEMYAPFSELSDMEVLELAKMRDFDLEQYQNAPDTANIHACTKCVNSTQEVFCHLEDKTIPAVSGLHTGAIC